MISRFFIDRPIFASVLSIVITLAGGIALFTLPIAQYPPISPPTVQVDCNYPGASAQVVAETVAAPIEQQVNGVENMLYMSSQCTNDGSYNLTVTFKHGVDLNMAQVLVQNRVSLAVPLLPDVIKQTGVTTRKKSPDILLAIALNSPDGRYDQLYLSNYALMHVKDELARLPGVSDVTMLGQRDYSMRVWVDPEKLAVAEHDGRRRGRAPSASRTCQVATGADRPAAGPRRAGDPGHPRARSAGWSSAEQFEDIIVKCTPDGRIDPDQGRGPGRAGRQERGHQLPGQRQAVGRAWRSSSSPTPTPSTPPTSSRRRWRSSKQDFPEGVDYEIRYDTTPFIRESIDEVFKTLREAVILVAVVVLLFLQNWRSAVIPLIAVPVAIVGTFAVMAALGFSLNNLTLFGLVLAIGIVVDDAIVVVEAVEHHIEHGMAPREATIRAMEEVSGPGDRDRPGADGGVRAVRVHHGITGQFFRQFALTIAVSTIISTFNSLTLSPALAALLLRPRDEETHEALPRLAFVVLGGWLGWQYLGPWLRRTWSPRWRRRCQGPGSPRRRPRSWVGGGHGAGGRDGGSAGS